jgi:hypothetical protein
MVKTGRVITTDFNLVKVQPVAYETDSYLMCAFVCSEGKLYVCGVLEQFLPNERRIINQCWDKNVTDEDFVNITKKMLTQSDRTEV